MACFNEMDLKHNYLYFKFLYRKCYSIQTDLFQKFTTAVKYINFCIKFPSIPTI